jgi:hypothetical protein
MSPAFATLLLVLLAGVLLTIPLLPAIIELRLKRDAQPLDVIQQYGGDIRHFAYGFRRISRSNYSLTCRSASRRAPLPPARCAMATNTSCWEDRTNPSSSRPPEGIQFGTPWSSPAAILRFPMA